MSVLTVDDAKAHLNITAEGNTGKLQGMIDAAEAAIARRVGPLEPTTVTVTTSGSAALNLPVYPILSLTSVTGDGGTVIPLAGLTVDSQSGVITGSAGFGSGAYVVTYTAGRETCPADLLMAVKEMVRHLWETQRGPTGRPGSNRSESTSNTIPGAAYIYPFRVEQLIAPHEQFGFA